MKCEPEPTPVRRAVLAVRRTGPSRCTSGARQPGPNVLADDRTIRSSGLRAPWATTERFVAARVLARAPTPSLLDELQSQVLVPVELALLNRS